MKPQPSLDRVQRWMLAQVRDAREGCHAAIGVYPAPHSLTFPVLSLHAACAEFMRAYYVASATGAWLVSGQRVTTSVRLRTQHDAISFARSTLKSRRGWGEPAWHDSLLVSRVMHGAGCSNASGFDSARSINTKVIEHLTTARNYFAHRGETSAVKLRALGRFYGVPARREPAEMLMHHAIRRPQSLLLDWIDEIESVVLLMPS